ncbi:hypothetical protein E2C01_025475 [Portunus trituberculatus]|uniref:Uncharacterized protein n=1 Tax=Portunus trituberculatus TaxID=210409 RepID=A0A5B7EG15_PORTR|nr:hypothetical protein [Portunus trituberculatus]
MSCREVWHRTLGGAFAPLDRWRISARQQRDTCLFGHCDVETRWGDDSWPLDEGVVSAGPLSTWCLVDIAVVGAAQSVFRCAPIR